MTRTLQLDLDPGLGRRAGLERALRQAIVDGRIPDGEALPSSRSLAADLGVSRATVVDAYEQLLVEGFIVAEQGRGTRVSYTGVEAETADIDRSYAAAFAHDFRPGQPDVSAFPRRAWLRSLRRVLADAPDAAFGYPDPRGTPELRRALGSYLGRARSVVADPGSINIVAGFGTGISFLAELLVRRGEHRIAVEDPMLFVHRHLLTSAGLDVVPIAVDDHGLRVDRLAASDVDAVLVCPAHQYPLGGTLSAERRAELVAWARADDRWIIEDDFDGEYRYDRRPVGALHALAPDRVIYAGTASKTLAPGLRLAWLVAPTALRSELPRTIQARGGVSTVEQLAFADLLEHGGFDRHIRTMRPRYRARRDAVREALDGIGWLRVPEHAAGLHVTALITAGDRDERSVEAHLAERSIGVLGLRRHYANRADAAGLVLGFANPPEHRFRSDLDALVTALAEI